MSIAVIQPLVGGFDVPTNPNPTVTTARTVVEPRPVLAGVSWPFSVFIYVNQKFKKVEGNKKDMLTNQKDTQEDITIIVSGMYTWRT